MENEDLWKYKIESRLNSIETSVTEIHEVFLAARGGFQTLEFLAKVVKLLLPIVLFCGITWGAVKQFFK